MSSTVTPRNYDSFATVILSQNHKTFDIAESILVSIKVVIACIPNNDFMLIPLLCCRKYGHFSLTAGGVENCCFSALGGHFPSKFDIVIPKTPRHKGLVVCCR